MVGYAMGERMTVHLVGNALVHRGRYETRKQAEASIKE